ncbi:MAG: hypothetical protein LBR69_05480 [Endomicrobium sp.]|jgi:hypothetical protein|nr:hypothetical protein [Endomicrobium sp.]
MARKFLLSAVCYFLFAVQSFAAITAYPNPWIPDSNRKDAGGANKVHGTYEAGITFSGLPVSGGTIFIYNSTGEVIRKIRWASGDKASWDGRNERHEYAASGVYIWVIKEGGTHTGRIVIIR